MADSPSNRDGSAPRQGGLLVKEDLLEVPIQRDVEGNFVLGISKK